MQVEPPLLITGCPRSGTSLTAEVFRRLGCWVGNVTSQTENRAIRAGILKPILRENGMDDLALRSFTDAEEGDPKMLRRGVERTLREQGYEGGPWLYKDCKLVFCWRLWVRAFPEATWATVWRTPAGIRSSMERWGLANRVDFDPDEVIREHHERARKIKRAWSVFPAHLRDGDPAEYRRVAWAYGLKWRERVALETVDPERFLDA